MILYHLRVEDQTYAPSKELIERLLRKIVHCTIAYGKKYIKHFSVCLRLIRACEEIKSVKSLRLTVVMMRCNMIIAHQTIIL